jgi:predicted esterase YcpF (UPF0227 family)
MRYLLINLHGFLSSHESEKVVQLRDYIESNRSDIHFMSPRLPNNPQAAVELAERLIADNITKYSEIALIGHSLGGYFATYIASRRKLKAVLVNPVVRAYEILCDFFGPCYNPHTDEHFEITANDIEYLVSINVEPVVERQLFLVMQQLGDEIIAPQTTLTHYQGCSTIVESGGCHDFAGLVNHAESILTFLFEDQAR